jgi:hypothetical protein
MNLKFLILKENIHFKKYDEAQSNFVANGTLEQTEITGIVKISGTLIAKKTLDYYIDLAAWLLLTLDEVIPPWWPRHTVKKKTSFFRKIQIFLKTGSWIQEEDVIAYDEKVILEEDVEFITLLSSIKRIS